MTDNAKEQLTLQALGILREQVEARVVHYKAELETSAELDAVTAQVVKQVKDLQAAAVRAQNVVRDPALIENAHGGTLNQLLSKIMVEDKNFVLRFIQPIGKRLARLFFESELHLQAAGDRSKTIHHSEQALYYILKRYHTQLRSGLEQFEYADASVREAALQLLVKTEKDLQVAFLSRRSPELNRVLSAFSEVLGDFFDNHLPPRLEQMSKITVRNAATGRQPNSVPYKVLPDRFMAFRTEWERVLMTQMIHFCGDELSARLEEADEGVQAETLNFFAEPQIYSETCGVVCNGLYDQLCSEGFLDLPVDWRMQMTGRQ